MSEYGKALEEFQSSMEDLEHLREQKKLFDRRTDNIMRWCFIILGIACVGAFIIGLLVGGLASLTFGIAFLGMGGVCFWGANAIFRDAQ